MLLQQQYRLGRFTEYYDDLVISLLVIVQNLVVKQNNDLLINNCQLCPTRTITYLEINSTLFNQGCGGYNLPKEYGGHARCDSRDQGRNHGQNHYRG